MADPVTDSNITLWQPDATTTDTNLPQGSSSMAPGGPTELAGELRVIKSVCREESLNKSWERWAGQYGTLAITNGTTFTLTGDQRTSNNGPVEVNRRIKALLSASVVYGYISAVSFALGTTTVTVVCDSGALDNTCTEIQFGVPLDIALPEDVLKTSTAPLYGVATGTNTYAVSIPAVASLVTGQAYSVKFTNASTAAVSLNINSLGATNITDESGMQLASGSIPAGAVLDLIYDGTAFRSVGSGGGSGALGNSCCIVTQTGAQTIGAHSAAALQWNSEIADPTGMHSNSVQNTRITILQAGVYLLQMYVEVNNSSSLGGDTLYFRINGTISFGSNTNDNNNQQHGGNGVPLVYLFAASDYIELILDNTSGNGSAPTVVASGRTPFFSVTALAAG